MGLSLKHSHQDCFQRAARRFLAENGSVAAAGQVSEDENKEKGEAVVELIDELEPAGPGGDVAGAVDLLVVDGSGEDVQEEGPEKEIITIKVDGEEKQAEIVEYDNGSVRDAETGRFLSPPNPNVFSDPEKARAAVTKRHAKATEEARMGLIRGVVKEGHDVKVPEEAWGIVVEKQTVAALSDKRAATGAARFVGQATGLSGEDKQQVNVQEGGAVIVVSLDGILLGMFNRLHPGDPQRALSEMRNYKDRLR